MRNKKNEDGQKKASSSTTWFRSRDLRVMSPARFPCAMVLMSTFIHVQYDHSENTFVRIEAQDNQDSRNNNLVHIGQLSRTLNRSGGN